MQSEIEAADVNRWYAVYTTSRHEKKIAEHFRSREIEYFLPLCSTARRWKDGSKGTVEEPLFPSYVFVRTSLNRRVRVLEVPGVIRLVGTRMPEALPEIEVEALRHGLNGRKFAPHPYLVVGERVRVVRGSLSGIQGVVIRQKNEIRIVISLDLIMRSVAVEVDAADIEVIDSPGGSGSSRMGEREMQSSADSAKTNSLEV